MVSDWIGRMLIGIGFLIVTEKYANNLISAIRREPYDHDLIADAWEGE